MRSEVWDNAERKVRCLKAVRRAQRLEQASQEELESWADRVLDAKRLEDVFGSG